MRRNFGGIIWIILIWWVTVEMTASTAVREPALAGSKLISFTPATGGNDHGFINSELEGLLSRIFLHLFFEQIYLKGQPWTITVNIITIFFVAPNSWLQLSKGIHIRKINDESPFQAHYLGIHKASQYPYGWWPHEKLFLSRLGMVKLLSRDLLFMII